MALVPCPKCGSMVSDQAANCPKCGAPVNSGAPSYQQQSPYPQQGYPQQAYPQQAYPAANNPQQQAYPMAEAQDVPNSGLNILSFLVPLAGWILYFVFRDQTPKKAKACSKWAWIGFAVSVVLWILYVLLLFIIEDYL